MYNYAYFLLYIPPVTIIYKKLTNVYIWNHLSLAPPHF